MAYGTVKVDTVTFTYASGDTSTTFSGLHASTTNNLTLSGTASANTFTGTTANFTNTNAQNISVTTLLSGLAITGETAGFTTVTGTTVTGTTANFVTVSGTTVTGNTGQFTNLAGAAAGFTTVTGTTVTGTTANFVSGVFTTRISGTTITGTTASFTSGVFASLSGTTHTITSGIFALGTAALPSISFVSDPNTGIYSPGADQLAVATNGTSRIHIDASGNVGLGITPVANTLIGGARGSALPGLIELAGNGNTVGATGFAIGQDGSGVGVLFQRANAAMYFATNGTECLRITSTGTLNFKGAGTAGSTQAVSFNGSAPVDSMLLDSSGRLGIGTSAPGAPLNVRFDNAGTTTIALFENQRSVGGSPDAAQIVVGARGYNHTIIRQNSDLGSQAIGTTLDTVISNTFGAALHIATGSPTNAARLTVTSAGLVGIGNTGPSLRLDVAATGDDGIRFSTTGTNNSARLELSSGNGTTSGKYAYIQIRNNDTNAQGYAFGTFGDDRWVIRDTKANSERLCVDTSGRLLVGTSSSLINGNSVQIAADSTNCLGLLSGRADAFGPRLDFAKSRGTTISPGNVSNDDQLANLLFSGYHGGYVAGAKIEAYVDGTPGANDMPGRLVFSTNPGSPATSPTERMRIKANGDVSIVTGNLIIGTAGKGIDFSADGNAAGMTSELLDDYEEGTWTPAVTFGGGTTGITYDGFTSGRYTKVGRLVTLHGTLKLTNKGASTGNALIIGFPFTPANANANYASSSVGGTAAITYTGTLIGAPEGINVHIALFSYTEAGTRTQLNETNFANNSELTFTITYTV